MGPFTRLRGALSVRRRAAPAGSGFELPPVKLAPDLLGSLTTADSPASESLTTAESPASAARTGAPDLVDRLDRARARLRAEIPPRTDG